MTSPGTLLLILFLILFGAAVLIALEGRRQRRRLGTAKRRGSGLMRTGMLELQALLEPEKKVEMLIEKKAPTAQQESGAPPEPPSPGSPEEGCDSSDSST